jgi:hypothetical protein
MKGEARVVSTSHSVLKLLDGLQYPNHNGDLNNGSTERSSTFYRFTERGAQKWLVNWESGSTSKS